MASYPEQKRARLSRLTGTVLEIGAGKGTNFNYYRSGVRWIGLEPNGRRASRLAQRAAGYGHHWPILVAHAERVPLADRTVDAVVSTIVLCSVADQARAVAEVKRVLRPGGVFVFFEHVAAERGTWTRRAQTWFAPLSRRLDSGCDPSRETWRTIEGAGFDDVDLGFYTHRGGLGVYSRLIVGEARVG
jgi:SAM-dependent methyltransferase